MNDYIYSTVSPFSDNIKTITDSLSSKISRSTMDMSQKLHGLSHCLDNEFEIAEEYEKANEEACNIKPPERKKNKASEISFRDYNKIVDSKVHIGTKNTYGNKFYGVGQSKPDRGGASRRQNPESKAPCPDPSNLTQQELQQKLGDTRRVCKDHLQFVARNLCQKWQALGLYLSLSMPKLSFIYEDYKHQVYSEVPFQVLLSWSHAAAPHDTVGELCGALVKVDLHTVVKGLR